MKKIKIITKAIITIVMITNSIFGQTSSSGATAPVNFARIISYNVLVKDTSTLIDNIRKNYGDTVIITPSRERDYLTINEVNENMADQYIDPISFRQFINVIKKYVNDKNAFFVLNDKQVSMAELKQKIYPCDTVIQTFIDNNGNERDVPVNRCDSTSNFNNTFMINFTESWSIDPKTFEFKKEILSYSLVNWWLVMDGSRFLRNWLTIYRNKAALEKVKSLTR
jgi:hypothetical protein